MANGTERFMKLNSNTVVSAVVGILVALVGYGGKHEFEKLDRTLDDQGKTIVANNMVLTRVEATQSGVLARLDKLEISVREFITRSEFKSELANRDQEIGDLKKELEGLRRRVGPPPFRDVKP
jgi:hypothetical protein